MRDMRWMPLTIFDEESGTCLSAPIDMRRDPRCHCQGAQDEIMPHVVNSASVALVMLENSDESDHIEMRT